MSRLGRRVIHLASGREWRGGQNQVLLLARALAARSSDIEQIVVTGRRSLLAQRLTAAGVPALAEGAMNAGASCVFDKLNDKPIRVVGYLHDVLGTTADTNTTLISKTGNPDAFTDF